MSMYGVEEQVDPGRGWNPPLPFTSNTVCLLLWRDFWGDEVVLHAISCMWSMKITVLNTKTLQEYRIWHDKVMEKTDIVITYNAMNHFNAAGMYSLYYEWLGEWVMDFALYLWTSDWMSDIPDEWPYPMCCIDGHQWMTEQVYERVTLSACNIWMINWMFDMLHFQSRPIWCYWSWCWSVKHWRCPGGRWTITVTLRMMELLDCLVRMRLRVCLLDPG